MKSDTNDQAAVFSIGQMACRITIKKCDIFTQEGLKAIHCPRTLETDSRIIFRNSLIGQFMSRHEHEKDLVISQINDFADAQTTKTLNPELTLAQAGLISGCKILAVSLVNLEGA